MRKWDCRKIILRIDTLMKDRSFKDWLQQHIQVVLAKATAPAPFILWCDPARSGKNFSRRPAMITSNYGRTKVTSCCSGIDLFRRNAVPA
jgi:hypothetical protein